MMIGSCDMLSIELIIDSDSLPLCSKDTNVWA